ncbi:MULTISPECIES: hypothetical protein [Pseudomonas]|uniref:hypothetical protein n=1 Tax=Pseudomonas TaxID=286 RepID=UPI001F1BC033|nr:MULTISPECIES: hypothetical protein [Pseudomonas]MDU4255958.1 hypothetical protein [Pseudomonas sp.]
MIQLSDDFVEKAASAFLYFVPSLADEINLGMPEGTPANRQKAYKLQKGWAELCISAHRAGLEPVEFAKQVIVLRDLERYRAA